VVAFPKRNNVFHGILQAGAGRWRHCALSSSIFAVRSRRPTGNPACFPDHRLTSILLGCILLFRNIVWIGASCRGHSALGEGFNGKSFSAAPAGTQPAGSTDLLVWDFIVTLLVEHSCKLLVFGPLHLIFNLRSVAVAQTSRPQLRNNASWKPQAGCAPGAPKKPFTMRAIARPPAPPPPTVYERYRDRNAILRALRIQCAYNFSPRSATPTPWRKPASPISNLPSSIAMPTKCSMTNFAQPPSLQRCPGRLQSHARASDQAPGRNSPPAHSPHAFGLVADAWHCDAFNSRRSSGAACVRKCSFLVLTQSKLLSPKLAVQGKDLLRPKWPATSDSRRGKHKAR